MPTLFLPHLNWPHPDELPPLDTPALNLLMRHGRTVRHRADTPAAFCFSALDIALPTAPSGRHTAFATPIRHQSGMHSVRLDDDCRILPEEAHDWCGGLNRLYADEDWHFTPVGSHLWQLSLPEPPDWQTPCSEDILGTADSHFRPQGRNGRQWQQCHTEIQMWLHQHPLNAARTDAQRPPVNGLWLWDSLPEAQPLPVSAAHTVATDSPWAAFSRRRTIPAPADFNDWRQHSPDSDLYLDGLRHAAHQGDWHSYGHTLQYWDKHFFQPAWEALLRRELPSLHILTEGCALTVQKPQTWRFWRHKTTFRGRLDGSC